MVSGVVQGNKCTGVVQGFKGTIVVRSYMGADVVQVYRESDVVQVYRGTGIMQLYGCTTAGKCLGVVQCVIQDIIDPGVVKCTGVQEQYSVTEAQE